MFFYNRWLTCCDLRTLKRTREEAEDEDDQVPSPGAKRVRIEEKPDEEWQTWKQTEGKERRGFPKPPPQRPYKKFWPNDRLDPDPIHAPVEPEEGEGGSDDTEHSDKGGDDDEKQDEEPEEEEHEQQNPEAEEQEPDDQPTEEPQQPEPMDIEDRSNELSNITKYSNENWRGNHHNRWRPHGDVLEPADREPISWLSYEKKYGADEAGRAAAKGQLWKEWDDDLMEVNPFTRERLR